MGSEQAIVVTGFGPFGAHTVNASWVAVQELGKLDLELDGIQVVAIEIPVKYNDVKKLIPDLWEKYKPLLMVHVGVSGIAEEITLEQMAHNDGYSRTDVEGLIPATHKCQDECKEMEICSEIDMSLICDEVNRLELPVKTVVSNDAGRYLCDFSYFTSLHISKKNSAFIHVPPLNCPYTGEQLALGLKYVIHAMVKQLKTIPS